MVPGERLVVESSPAVIRVLAMNVPFQTLFIEGGGGAIMTRMIRSCSSLWLREECLRVPPTFLLERLEILLTRTKRESRGPTHGLIE